MVWSILIGALCTAFKVYLLSFAVVLLIIGLLTWGCNVRSGPVAKFNYQIKFFLVYLSSFSSAVFLSPIFLLKPRNVLNSQYSAWFVRVTTEVLGVTTEVRNSKTLAEDRGAMICLNHQSALDVIGLFMLIPILRKATPIIKKSLLYVLPYGPCTWLAGAFFVDRSSPKAAYKTLTHCANEMNKKKIKLYMFPEGTRNRDRGLLPFKRGAFKTAIMAQVPIIPVVISPYYFIDHKRKQFDNGHVIMKALEPISTKGMVDADNEALMERTRNIMLEEYEKLAAEVDEMSQKKEWRDMKRPRVSTDGKGN